MKTNFHVQVLSFSNLLEIEGARTADNFAALLDVMEYGDRSGLNYAELRDMCILSLQDLKPEDAAYLVLKHDMGEVLRDGQARNLASEMLDEKLWEEYAYSSLHERLFNIGSLLYEAFPRSFPKPDAVRVELEITAANAPARELLTPLPKESFLVRLLADGMDSHSVLQRLYGEQLKGKSFPNAHEIVWIVRTEMKKEDVMKLDVIGSGCWLDALADTKAFDSVAYADEIPAPHH